MFSHRLTSYYLIVRSPIDIGNKLGGVGARLGKIRAHSWESLWHGLVKRRSGRVRGKGKQVYHLNSKLQ